MKNNIDYYKRAIELLQRQSDWKAICVTIAQRHPKVFCDACPTLYADDFEEAVVKEYRLAGFIPAIKYTRKIKNWGLKEAKDYVDALRHKHSL